jgi:hypothetical protein
VSEPMYVGKGARGRDAAHGWIYDSRWRISSIDLLLDPGLALGGGAEVPIGKVHVFVESQYMFGLTPIHGIGDITNSRNRGLQVRTGITLSVLGR